MTDLFTPLEAAHGTWEYNRIHPIEKENHLNQTESFSGSMLPAEN